MWTQILYDSGYDPRAMAQSFEKIEAKSGFRSAEFFSDHPNPGNRISSVNQEIARRGGAKRPKSDSAEFQRIKRILKST
jgi:predicted Zn-dependent protease